MPAVANHFLLLHLPRNAYQEDLLHGFPRDWRVLETTLLLEIVPTSM